MARDVITEDDKTHVPFNNLNDLRRRSRPKGYIFCGPKKLHLTRIKKKQGIGGLRSGALHNGGDCVPLFLARNVQEQPKGECHE